jgi:hypothetical protein
MASQIMIISGPPCRIISMIEVLCGAAPSSAAKAGDEDRARIAARLAESRTVFEFIDSKFVWLIF